MRAIKASVFSCLFVLAIGLLIYYFGHFSRDALMTKKDILVATCAGASAPIFVPFIQWLIKRVRN